MLLTAIFFAFLVTSDVLCEYNLGESDECIHARWDFDALNLSNSTEPLNLRSRNLTVLEKYAREIAPAKFYTAPLCVYAALLGEDDQPTGEILYNFPFGHATLIPDVEELEILTSDMCADSALEFNAGILDLPLLNLATGNSEKRNAVFMCCPAWDCPNKRITVSTILHRAMTKRVRNWDAARTLQDSKRGEEVPMSECHDVMGYKTPKIELNEAVRGCYTTLVFVNGRLNVTLSTSDDLRRRGRQLCEETGKKSSYSKNFCVPPTALNSSSFVESNRLEIACCCFQDRAECSRRASIRPVQHGCLVGNFKAQFLDGSLEYTEGTVDLDIELNLGCKFVVDYFETHNFMNIALSSVKDGQNDECEDHLDEEVKCLFKPGESDMCPFYPPILKRPSITCCCRGHYCNFNQMHNWLKEYRFNQATECGAQGGQDFPLLNKEWSMEYCNNFYLVRSQSPVGVLPGINSGEPVLLDRASGMCQQALVQFDDHAVATCPQNDVMVDEMRGNVHMLVCNRHVGSRRGDLMTELYFTSGALSVYCCKEGVSSSEDVGISTAFRNGISTTSSMCYTRIYSYGIRDIDGEDVGADKFFIEKGFVDQRFRDTYGNCENVAETHCHLMDDESVVCCCFTNGNNACNDGFPRLGAKRLIESRLRTINDDLYDCPSKAGVVEACETPGCFSLRDHSMSLIAAGCINPSHAAYSTGKEEPLSNENWRRLCNTYKQGNGCWIVYASSRGFVHLCCCESPDTCEEFYLSEGRSIKHVRDLK